jgi:hypothetical protein
MMGRWDNGMMGRLSMLVVRRVNLSPYDHALVKAYTAKVPSQCSPA